MFLALIIGLVALIYRKISKDNEREGEERLYELKIDAVQLSGQDSLIKDTEIPKKISDEKLEEIIEIHKKGRGEFIKINKGVLKAVFSSENREDELFSIELFTALTILSKTINRYTFLPTEFKKPLIYSIGWYRTTSFKKESEKVRTNYKKFEDSLNLNKNEKTIFEELNGLNHNDRVIHIIFPKLEDLKKMPLREKQKSERFKQFYGGLKSLAFEKHIDNLEESSMIYVGGEKTHEEVVVECLAVIKSTLKNENPDIIVEARGYYTNIAMIIVGQLLFNKTLGLMVGGIRITKHYYPNGSIQPKTLIYLIKSNRVSVEEINYYDEKEQEILRLKEHLSKNISTISPRGDKYTEKELEIISNSMIEHKTVLYETDHIPYQDSNFHKIILLVLKTIQDYRRENHRILIPFCVMMHTPHPKVFIVLRWMGTYESKDVNH